MTLEGVSYRGPAISDRELLATLPQELQAILGNQNGFIAFDGGLHVRGICIEPAWHSLATVWSGSHALANLYPGFVLPSDIPFAQDCVGDQLLLRDGVVHRLSAETGDVRSFALDLPAFLDSVRRDPVGVLMLQPLVRLRSEGRALAPGQVLHAWPPFCTKEAANGVCLKPVPALECLAFHADLAKQLRSLPSGAKVKVVVTE